MKKLVIFVIITLGLGALAFVYNNRSTQPSTSNDQVVYYPTKEECEKHILPTEDNYYNESDSTVGYRGQTTCVQQICDYAPKGKTIEEVCGKGYKKGFWSQVTGL